MIAINDMKDGRFSKPVQEPLADGANDDPVTVFLAGVLAVDGKHTRCFLRSVTPHWVTLEARLRLKPGDRVRIDLRGGRELSGGIEAIEGDKDELARLRLTYTPNWVMSLCRGRYF